MEIQYRHIAEAELMADENRMISGYGIVFDSDSSPLQIWDDQTGRIVEAVEIITRESLKGADMRDVISAFNHDFDKVLGRTTSGTLKLSTDAKSVAYRANAPNTTYADDVLELLKRGDLSGSSFVFSMDWGEGYDIKERADGVLQASPIKITKVYEMGPVVNPAYPETTAQNRSAALEGAIKRFLEAKQAKKEEEVQTRTVEPETVEPQAETQTITYPVTARYIATAKVMKLKNKRV